MHPLVSRQAVKIATPPTLAGNRLNTGNMIQNLFPFIQESTMANGTTAVIVIQTLLVIHNLPVSIAMITTNLPWIASMPVSTGTHGTVLPVLPVIRPVPKTARLTMPLPGSRLPARMQPPNALNATQTVMPEHPRYVITAIAPTLTSQ